MQFFTFLYKAGYHIFVSMEMKSLTLLLCGLIVHSAPAQKISRWEIGLGLSPDYCFRSIHNTSKSAGAVHDFNDRSRSEEKRYGYTAGFWARYEHSDVLQFESGLQYSNKGYLYHITNMFDPSIPSIGGNYVRHRFLYLDIPLKVNLTVAKLENQSFHFTGGIATNILLEQKNVNFYKNSRGGTLDGKYNAVYDASSLCRPINFTVFAGVGLDFTLSEKVHLQVDPLFRYGLVPVYKSDPIRTRLWSFGINTIMYIRL